jgi:hypothetical protein
MRSWQVPPQVAVAATMACVPLPLGRGGSWLRAALGIHRVALLLCLVYLAATAASKRGEHAVRSYWRAPGSMIMPNAAQPHSLCIVLRNAHTMVVAASNCILAEAAARCSALPGKRNPFPCILDNTGAYNEAAAECALAVRAAHGRSGCSERPDSKTICGS